MGSAQTDQLMNQFQPKPGGDWAGGSQTAQQQAQGPIADPIGGTQQAGGGGGTNSSIQQLISSLNSSYTNSSGGIGQYLQKALQGNSMFGQGSGSSSKF